MASKGLYKELYTHKFKKGPTGGPVPKFGCVNCFALLLRHGPNMLG